METILNSVFLLPAITFIIIAGTKNSKVIFYDKHNKYI